LAVIRSAGRLSPLWQSCSDCSNLAWKAGDEGPTISARGVLPRRENWADAAKSAVAPHEDLLWRRPVNGALRYESIALWRD
jgi:hypothetical protein